MKTNNTLNYKIIKVRTHLCTLCGKLSEHLRIQTSPHEHVEERIRSCGRCTPYTLVRCTSQIYNEDKGINMKNSMKKDKNKFHFQNCIRMSSEDFEKLVNLVGPIVSKQNTNIMRPAITVEVDSVTLQCLAYSSLQYLYKISK